MLRFLSILTSANIQAARAQLDVTTKYPQLAEKLSKMTVAAQQGGFMG